MLRLERTVLVLARLRRLLRVQRRQPHTKLGEEQTRDVFVEMFGQCEHARPFILLRLQQDAHHPFGGHEIGPRDLAVDEADTRHDHSAAPNAVRRSDRSPC